MGTAEWISILIAVIGVIGVLATTLFQLKRDGKTIDKIDNRTEDISKATFTVNNISTSVDKANEMLNSITPEIKTISHTTNKIDFIASEIEYQKRLNEKVSTDISNKDVIVETIKKLYEENARLNKSLQMEKANNLISDICKKEGFESMLFTDSLSGFLMDELWERVQKDYDEIIRSKEE